jgi:glycosyltransferase involved in cell wall biosynthesis
MKVSIITVGYNCHKTIAKAMDSVLQQTYPDIEYLVVDGDSTDGTIDIIKSFEPKFNGRMHWISEKDEGIYDAMNKGIKMATGDIIGILNSDDFLSSDTIIERVVEQFFEHVELIYGDVHFVKPGNPDKNVRNYTGRFFKPWMIRYGYFPPHPSIYVRRELYENFGLYDSSMRISADFKFFANLVHNHHVNMKYLPMDFVTMLTGGESTKSIKQRELGTHEDKLACQQLGISTNWLFIRMKYVFKAVDAMIPKRNEQNTST